MMSQSCRLVARFVGRSRIRRSHYGHLIVNSWHRHLYWNCPRRCHLHRHHRLRCHIRSLNQLNHQDHRHYLCYHLAHRCPRSRTPCFPGQHWSQSFRYSLNRGLVLRRSLRAPFRDTSSHAPVHPF